MILVKDKLLLFIILKVVPTLAGFIATIFSLFSTAFNFTAVFFFFLLLRVKSVVIVQKNKQKKN